MSHRFDQSINQSRISRAANRRCHFQTTSTLTAGGRPLNLFVGVQNLTNRRNFASYSWNRRSNTQQFGEQQGIFPVVGLDWRF